MNNYVIITDSTTDLPQNKATEWSIEIIPYIFNLDGKEYYNYLDWRDLSVTNFYGALRAGKTGSTTQVNQFRYMEIWEPFLQEGKDVLYMCLSSALSKSYDQSMLAARELREKFPDRKIITIDTKSASLAQGMLAYYAAKGRDEGKNIDELAAYLEGLIPNLHHWIMADDLHHLRRGGRVSGAAAFVGTMLSVKPMLHVTKEGKLTPMHKARGHNKALEFMVEQLTAHEMNPGNQPLFISHSDAPDLAEQLKNLIIAKHGKHEFIINEIGPVIGAHTGPGTIALFFLGNERRG
ncbi:MAG: DegV family protein [Defluviitaleaceae bacterium]|nr:DegV family protein [Defluviitaleaceae bacterium]MCL2275480.1 DegV family protein [Defluviitaleaceae bacterium]